MGRLEVPLPFPSLNTDPIDLTCRPPRPLSFTRPLYSLCTMSDHSLEAHAKAIEEKGYGESVVRHDDGHGLKRQLKNRHIAMIRFVPLFR